MGTKQNPGVYDCYNKAEPDEPMFVLLARDPLAPRVIRYWIDLQSAKGIGGPKIDEASQCARDMEAWRDQRKK